MAGWQRHLLSMIREVGKRVEHNYMSSAKLSWSHYDPSLLQGQFICLSSVVATLNFPLFTLLESIIVFGAG